MPPMATRWARFLQADPDRRAADLQHDARRRAGLFRGGRSGLPEGYGFALKGWTKCEAQNSAIFIAGRFATTLGNVMITGKDGKVTTVDKPGSS